MDARPSYIVHVPNHIIRLVSRRAYKNYMLFQIYTGDTGSYSLSVFYIPWAIRGIWTCIPSEAWITIIFYWSVPIKLHVAQEKPLTNWSMLFQMTIFDQLSIFDYQYRAPDNFQVQRVITPYFWKWCVFAYFLYTVVLSTSEKIAYMYTFKIMFDTSVIQ